MVSYGQLKTEIIAINKTNIPFKNDCPISCNLAKHKPHAKNRRNEEKNKHQLNKKTFPFINICVVFKYNAGANVLNEQ